MIFLSTGFLKPEPAFAAECALVLPFPNPHREWLRQRIEGLEFISSGQFEVIDEFVGIFWKRFSSAGRNLKIIIIPYNQKLTDLRPFEHLRGIRVGDRNPQHFYHSGDGYNSGERYYDDLKGCNKGPLCVVGIQRFKENRVGHYHTIYHELGHFIEREMLSSSEKKRLRSLYLQAMKRNRFLNNYSKIDQHEYFAEAVEAYSAETKDARFVAKSVLPKTKYGLQLLDPDLYYFIENLVRTEYKRYFIL